MIRQYFYLFFLSICLASCSSQSSHWVERAEVQPTLVANIKSVVLVDGSVLEFNSSLGWYDPEKQTIEGVTITGWHPTIPLAKVQRAEIVEYSSNAGGTIGIILLVLLGLCIVGGIELANTFRGGCLILVQLAIVSVAAMTAVLLIIFL